MKSKGLNVSHISQYKKEINQLKSEIDWITSTKASITSDLMCEKIENRGLREKLLDYKITICLLCIASVILSLLVGVLSIISLFK